ncbi:hypothetical protein RND71_031507 [Anisodus tanguticus]|uniref:NAC domain-containing protein n=1 Tax=Anisodus tanguticus TaxID=243964 RepID=A0AAE1RDQ3_9SOLA|nr:hypothetical protein RND71_031507 [Anisodus tanguticus]
MCPLASSAPPPGFMSSCWTNEEIILSLDRFNCGSPVPDDVIVDNPYQYDPSNLPDGAWFLVSSSGKKETKHGLWKAKGSACEIFADSVICGWRTTFEFSQVHAPIEQKTVWMMQEYKIMQKGENDQNKSKVIFTTIFPLLKSLIIYRFNLVRHASELLVWLDILQESTLCRVFSCCNEETKPEHKNKINNEKNPEQNDDLDTWLQLSLMPSVNQHTSSNDEQRSISESQVNNQTVRVGSSLVDKFKDPSGDDIVAELDCILREDYLELDDLGDVASHSSSSGNSSRLSFASDECFDSLAFLRDLDGEKNQDLSAKGSTSNYYIMMCEIANDVVVEPAPLESLVKGSGAAAKETQQAADNNKSKCPREPSPDQAAKRLKAERTDEGPSHSCRATTSSSSSNSHKPGLVARREEKRMKKLMKYFCFMSL